MSRYQQGDVVTCAVPCNNACPDGCDRYTLRERAPGRGWRMTRNGDMREAWESDYLLDEWVGRVQRDGSWHDVNDLPAPDDDGLTSVHLLLGRDGHGDVDVFAATTYEDRNEWERDTRRDRHSDIGYCVATRVVTVALDLSDLLDPPAPVDLGAVEVLP